MYGWRRLDIQAIRGRRAASKIRRYNFATAEARAARVLAPKRHGMNHLDFDLLFIRDQGVEVEILCPRPFLIFGAIKD
jgi:hypothetical protein